MNIRQTESRGRQDALEDLAEQLTSTAYAVVLQHQQQKCWLDLELDLWRTVSESLRSTQEDGVRVA